MPRLLGNPAFASYLEERLHRLPGVHQITANPDSGRLLLLFDPERLRLQSLRDHLAIGPSASQGLPTRREALVQTLVPGMALAVVAAKRWLLGPSALSQSWFTYDVAGLVTAVASYPFLRRGTANLLERRRINADLLIGVAGLCMAFVRENVLALTALFLNGLNNLLLNNAVEASGSRPSGRPSGASAILMERSTKLSSAWGAVALGAGVIAGLFTLNWRLALATLIAAAPAAPALSASLPLGAALVRGRQLGVKVRDIDGIASAGLTNAASATEGLPALGRQAVKAVHQNLAIQTGMNAAGLVLAVSGLVTPLGASLWHNATSLALQFNAMKLMRCSDSRFKTHAPCP